jgi:NAD dependent epimerase/dehydratase family enzyme
VNLVAPEPVTNAEFTKTLGRVLSRPTLFPVPAFGVRLVFGEMADALLLSSQRVDAAVLEDRGYLFKWPTLEPALRHLLAE